jgi:hypothetical protein
MHKRKSASSRRTSRPVHWLPEHSSPMVQRNPTVPPCLSIPRSKRMRSNFRRVDIPDHRDNDVTGFVHLRARQHRDSLRLGPVKALRKTSKPSTGFGRTTSLTGDGFERSIPGLRDIIQFENMHKNSSDQGLQNVRDSKESLYHRLYFQPILFLTIPFCFDFKRNSAMFTTQTFRQAHGAMGLRDLQ